MNSDEKIIIQNPKKDRCSQCQTTLRMRNEKESMFCNAIIIYSNADHPSKIDVKCRICKTMNTIDIGE